MASGYDPERDLENPTVRCLQYPRQAFVVPGIRWRIISIWIMVMQRSWHRIHSKTGTDSGTGDTNESFTSGCLQAVRITGQAAEKAKRARRGFSYSGSCL